MQKTEGTEIKTVDSKVKSDAEKQTERSDKAAASIARVLKRTRCELEVIRAESSLGGVQYQVRPIAKELVPTRE